MRIIDFVSDAAIAPRLSSLDAAAIVTELASQLAEVHGLEPERVRKALADREQLGTTAIGHQIAVPHGKLEVSRPLGLLGLSPGGVDFGAPDGEAVHFFVAFVSPKDSAVHLNALAAIAHELANPDLRRQLLAATSAVEIHRLLASERPRRDSDRARRQSDPG